MAMLILSFFSWWYGRGWQQVAKSLTSRVRGVANAFSVQQLLRTLFAPWRRIMSYPGASLGDRLRAWSDNVFSRVVGFVVRLLVLFTALVTVIVVAALTVIELVLWPLLPLAVPGCIVAGIII